MALSYLARDPIHRSHHHDELTFRNVYAGSERFVLPLSHDEVVHGKGSLLSRMWGDPWQSFANLRLLYTYMFTSPGKKLLFMGAEFAQAVLPVHDRQRDPARALAVGFDHPGVALAATAVEVTGALRRKVRAQPGDGHVVEWLVAAHGGFGAPATEERRIRRLRGPHDDVDRGRRRWMTCQGAGHRYRVRRPSLGRAPPRAIRLYPWANR